MTSFIAFRALLPLMVLSGCTQTPDSSSDYSPGYSHVSMKLKKGEETVLVPDACLEAPADSAKPEAGTVHTIVSDTGAHLPPGCANAYNLQRMAERQRDLVEGRRMGSAAAAPSVNAARRYRDGTDERSDGTAPSTTVPRTN